MFRILSYIEFLLKSTNQHGVHSPFVFDFVTKCFYNKKKYTEYQLLKNHRNTLLKCSKKIEVSDFGAGSKVFKTNRRKVSQMVKTAGISKKRAELLFRIVNYFKPTQVIELGTSLGLSAYAIYLGNPDAKIKTVEGCKNTQEVTLENIPSIKKESISFINSTFDNFLAQTDLSDLKQNDGWHLIYFDGNHSKKSTLDYFQRLLPTITNQTLWIFDDIYWSKQMQEAWIEIKNHPHVIVTIDTYQWGLVFFRKQQAKENFVIKLN